MIVLSSLLGTPENGYVRQFLTDARRSDEEELRRLIEGGIAAGDVPKGARADRIAAFYTAVVQGLSIWARDGASHDDLDFVVNGAMGAWDALVEEQPPVR